MRKILLTALSAIAAASAGAADYRWIETEHDFGAFDEELGIVTCEFKLVNTGTEPISIVSARANCGCTRPSYDTAPVAPGDTAVVSVGFDPKGRPGKFMKRVFIDTSAEPARSTLEIKGTVIGASNTLRSRYPVDYGPMKLRGTTVAYGTVMKDKTAGKYLEGYNASADTLRPRIEGAPRHISVIVEPKAVAPGEQFVISTIFHSEKTPDWGVSTSGFRLFHGPGDTEGLDVETVAIIKEDFSGMTPEQMDRKPVVTVNPSTVDLGSITHASKPVKATFSITNSGEDPLVIRSIVCPDKAVDVACKTTKIKKGKRAEVTVTVNPALIGETELLNARITVTTNDPLHPSTIVRVVAEVK